MVRPNIVDNLKRGLDGEKNINPASNNPEVAQAIAKYNVNRRDEGEDYAKREFESLHKTIVTYYGKRDLAKRILEIQPFYYDESKNWWRWDTNNLFWELIDETDILNIVEHLAIYNTVNSKEKNEILEALKQESRKHKPEEMKKTWIQFDKIIYDIQTGDKIAAIPLYFTTNPIPYKLSLSNFENTPTMDRIFEEWVGKDHIKTLYEIIAYCLLPDYPINRLFCFVGAGLNGKSCFLNLLKKFIGKNNCCSTELDLLLASRFEVTRLHKKLVCMMGETNFGEIKNTSILKKLTGGDLIGFEYKNKNPFQDTNYAKICISTNNLPSTTDKTIGFYRRWMIIDFPNQFSEQKDILSIIPEEEFESLALKSCSILKELLEKRTFTNDGSIEDRIKRYEEKSNFLDKFIKDFIEEDVNGIITKAELHKRFTKWCKENRHREVSEITLSKNMKDRGFEGSTKHFEWMNDGRGGNARVWLGLKWKD
jgi:P4 family phage/plasmid primase-like protien